MAVTEALLIIDVQNDFTPGGALAVPEGDKVISTINRHAASERFDLVVATRDWHPEDHSSFEEHGGPWPRHCVAETPGAELHPELERAQIDVIIDKGQEREKGGYSGFERPQLGELLRERGVDKLTIVGLATDVCVRSTALDALQAGFEVEVDPAGTRGVDPERSQEALEEIERSGGRVLSGSA